MQSKSYPQTKGRSMGGPVHRRSRSGNWQGHHQKCPRKNASGSKRKAEESHRGKRGHRLRAGQDLHGGELAGGLDGELRKNQTAPINLQNLARLSRESHQAANWQHPAGRSHFSGLGTYYDSYSGPRPVRNLKGVFKNIPADKTTKHRIYTIPDTPLTQF